MRWKEIDLRLPMGILFLALCPTAFWAGLHSTATGTATYPSDDPAEQLEIADTKASMEISGGRLHVFTEENKEEPVRITGSSFTGGTLRVLVKNTADASRESVLVCWKQFDKDKVVVGKDCKHVEENPVDSGDITDAVIPLTPDERTESISLFVTSEPFTSDTQK